MRKQRYEVVSGYGAWAPYPPVELNRIIDRVNAQTALRDVDGDPEQVKKVLDEVASQEVQEKYRLLVQVAQQVMPEMRVTL